MVAVAVLVVMAGENLQPFGVTINNYKKLLTLYCRKIDMDSLPWFSSPRPE